MSHTAKLATLILAATALAGCAATATEPPAADSSPKPTVEATPPPTHLTELPDWAQGSTWIIYPEGFQCSGTEGCPNSYRHTFGEPGPVLPAGVEYYEPSKHDCVMVEPAGVDCMNRNG